MCLQINPEILKWARERLKLTIDALATQMHSDLDEILRWERDEGNVAYSCLEELAYRHIKIPVAVFLFLLFSCFSCLSKTQILFNFRNQNFYQLIFPDKIQ